MVKHSNIDRIIGRARAQYNRKKITTNNKWNSLMYIYKGDKHTDKLNVGPQIKLHRGFKDSRKGRSKNPSLSRMDFLTSRS